MELCLTRNEFLEAQLRLDWSNRLMASYFSVAPSTITSWRNGVSNVPCYVRRMLNSMIREHGSLEKAGEEVSFTKMDKLLF